MPCRPGLYCLDLPPPVVLEGPGKSAPATRRRPGFAIGLTSKRQVTISQDIREIAGSATNAKLRNDEILRMTRDEE